MSDKEKLDGYLALMLHHASRHDRRREYEWKVSLSMWAALVGIFALVKDVPLNPTWFWIAGPIGSNLYL